MWLLLLFTLTIATPTMPYSDFEDGEVVRIHDSKKSCNDFKAEFLKRASIHPAKKLVCLPLNGMKKL